jgi:hypothetical protein
MALSEADDEIIDIGTRARLGASQYLMFSA